MAEIEIKFRVEEDAVLDRLAAAEQIPGFQIQSRVTFEQSDEYWDTPDGAASANGVSIRRRTTGRECQFTVKSGKIEGGLSRRLEIQEPCGDTTLIEWLESLLREERLTLPFSPGDLAPKLTVRNRRTALQLKHASSAEIELALDRVTFLGPRGEASELEIEGELLSGDEAALMELRDWLSETCEVTPSHGSKYERALQLVG